MRQILLGNLSINHGIRFEAHLSCIFPARKEQKPLEIRQGSCTAFAQSDGVICTSDLIRASLEKYKYFTKIITHRIMKSNHLF